MRTRAGRRRRGGVRRRRAAQPAAAIRAPARARATWNSRTPTPSSTLPTRRGTTGELTTGESTTANITGPVPRARIPPATSTRRCPGSGPLAWVGEWATKVFWTKRKMGRRRMGMGTFWGDAGDRRARVGTRRSRRRRRTTQPRGRRPPRNPSDAARAGSIASTRCPRRRRRRPASASRRVGLRSRTASSNRDRCPVPVTRLLGTPNRTTRRTTPRTPPRGTCAPNCRTTPATAR